MVGMWNYMAKEKIKAHQTAQTQNLDEHSFDMLFKNYYWAAILDPVWTTSVPYERKLNMLLSTDNMYNVKFSLFDFDRFRIESRLFLLTLYVIYSYTQQKWTVNTFFQVQIFFIYKTVLKSNE